jgi:hypothetical protein
MDRKMFIKQSGTLMLFSTLHRSGLNNLKLKDKSEEILSKSICATCGTQFPPDKPLPQLCPICDDDRQYINVNGQQWTSLENINQQFGLKVTKRSESLYELKMVPDFAIGQRAFLILSPNGNILWDCIPMINEAVMGFIKEKGGLKAIAISHPHYYCTMTEWAKQFNCPVYIHSSDQQWIMNKSSGIKLWDGYEFPLWDGMKIYNIGGHFPGSSVLHIPQELSKGLLLCGDSLYIARSKKHIAVMHSYPNQIALSKREFTSVYNKSANLKFDTMLGAFEGQDLIGNADEIFLQSMNRYKSIYEA